MSEMKIDVYKLRGVRLQAKKLAGKSPVTAHDFAVAWTGSDKTPWFECLEELFQQAMDQSVAQSDPLSDAVRVAERVRVLETALSNLVQATQDPDYCTVCRRNTVKRPGHASWCWASKSLALLAAAAPPAQQCKHDWVPSLRVIDPINPYPEVRGHHCSKCGAAEPSDAVRVAERRVIEAAREFHALVNEPLLAAVIALDDAASPVDPPEARQGAGEPE